MQRLISAALLCAFALAIGCSGDRSTEPVPVQKSLKSRFEMLKKKPPSSRG